MAICHIHSLKRMRVLALFTVLIVGGCAVPLSNLLDPIQTYEREFPAIYDDIWLHAIDAIDDNQVIKKSDYDEGLIVIEPNSNSTMSSNMADCGAQPFETTLEKSYTATISISELGEESTRVNVKVDYRINSQSQIDQRVRVFYCRSTGFWEKYVLNRIENQL